VERRTLGDRGRRHSPSAVLVAIGAACSLALVSATANAAPPDWLGVAPTFSPSSEGAWISGKVTDATTKAAVDEIEVCALDPGVDEPCASSDSNGEYVVAVHAAGPYKVVFNASGRGPKYATQYYAGKSALSEADPVSVTAGIVTGSINGSLQPAGEITGTVSDAKTGAVVKGARACALKGAEEVRCGMSDFFGNYSIGSLASGSYRVKFPGGLNGGSGYATQYYKGKLSLSEADSVSVSGGSTAPRIDAALTPGGQITGKVTNDANGPLEEVEVTVQEATGGTTCVCAFTNSTGEYAITGLDSGTYKVGFSSSGNYLSQYFNGKSSVSEADGVLVAAGATTAGIDATLKPGGQIVGTVSDASNKALVEPVTVCAFGQTTQKGDCAGTTSSGEYTIAGLPSDSYIVEFYASGALPAYERQYYNGKSSLSEANPVTVAAGSTTHGIDAAMLPSAKITGKVTDSSTQASVDTIRVCAVAAKPPSICSSPNSSGEYSIAGLEPGGYRVEFSGGGYLAQYYNGKSSLAEADVVSVAAASTTPGINAAMHPGGRIAGKVTDASTNAAVGGVLVCAREAGEQGAGCATTGSSGEYIISGLASGSYAVEFQAEGYPTPNYLRQYYNGRSAFAEADAVAVTAGATTAGIDAAMQPGGQIAGKVTDVSTRALIEGAEACAIAANAHAAQADHCAATMSSGEYTISGLPSGSYKVLFSANQGYAAQYYDRKGSLAEADVVGVIAGSTSSGIDAALQPGGYIAGKVTDALTQAPLAGISVCATSVNGGEYGEGCGTTDARGAYTTAGLETGWYLVSFFSTGNFLPQYYNDKSGYSEANPVLATRGSTMFGVDASLLSPSRAPTNIVIPAITGSPVVGEKLSCSNGSWSGNPPPTFSQSWQRDGTPIDGGQGPTYIAGRADGGHTLTCSVVASNAAGTQRVTSGGVVILDRPRPGTTANLVPVSGSVLIKEPRATGFRPLVGPATVPLGTVVDTASGTVQLISAADVGGKQIESGLFWSGVFDIGQLRAASGVRGGRRVLLTTLALVGPTPTACRSSHGAQRTRARVSRIYTSSAVHRLWGHAKGNFRTVGHYASATVRGTQWLTEDTCAGTLVRVIEGVVSVLDIPDRRSVLVRAPRSLLAHPGRGR
jgi:Carboxypeptidase regulatory-like domain